jgi:large subunit ribosomal protein L14
MIQKETKLIILDNSGGRILKCISLKNSYKTVGSAFYIKGAIQRLRQKRRSKSRVKLGKLYTSLIIQVNRDLIRKSGKHIRFCKNFCIIIGKNNEPLATRIFSGVPKEARTKRKSKLFLMASFIY